MSNTEKLSDGEKKHVLFVDDEENVLTGLKRTVRSLRHEIDASFVHSGQQALQFLAENECDVLVTDMRMPGLDGAELLREVASEYPQIIRILLSGQCDLDSFIGSACPAHQLLAKPCEADALKRTIERTIALRSLLNDESIRCIVMQMNTLPSPPTLYLRIEEELQQANSSMQRIGAIIGEDIGMTAKLLQLVNSPFFGFNRNIDSPAQAAALLGSNMVQFIMLHLQTFAISEPGLERVMEQISEHCMQVAKLARAITKLEGQSSASCLHAYLGGMMHDLGRLIIAVNMPEDFHAITTQVEYSSHPAWKIEQQQIGATHAEIGAYLLALWGLPEHVVEIVRFHHTPGSCTLDDCFALAAVHVADAVVHHGQLDKEDFVTHLDMDYLDRLGFSGRVADWQSCCLSILEQEQDG